MAKFWLLVLVVLTPSASDQAVSKDVLVELERSASQYRARREASDVAQYVRDLCRKHRDDTIMILDGRLLVFRDRFLSVKKRANHALLLLSSVHTLKKEFFPNVIYPLIQSSSGEPYDPATRISTYASDIPIAVISKKYGYDQPGILVPNPFMANGNLSKWKYETMELNKYAQVYPWSQRDSRLFWRGNLGSHTDCERDSGNYARLAAISLSLQHPQSFDIKCRKCHPRNLPYNVSNCRAPRPFDASMSKLTDPLQASISMLAVTDMKYQDKATYARYRGLLNLPGSTNGGYSRNLNHLWFLGAVVFFWEDPFVEFYFPALRPYQTHLVLNKSNALDQITHINMNETNEYHLSALLQGAQHVADTLLCATCLAHYMAAFFDVIRRRFTLGTVLDNADLLGRALEDEGVDCVNDLVELLPSHSAHSSNTIVRSPSSPNGGKLVQIAVPHASSCTTLFRDFFNLKSDKK